MHPLGQIHVATLLLLCKIAAGLTMEESTSSSTTIPEVPLIKNNPCQPDKLVAYKVILHTFWTRDQFPKHYPEWRPTAQWSRLIGRSHGAEYTLFRTGSRVSESVKVFAESALGTGLEDSLGQGADSILDDFSAPAIATGAGRSEAIFHTDSNHSLVSLMSKIVPSPDWFIGLDSFQLCVEGGWLDSITIEADPLDAGTDNGFTFTAPNWPTDPQGIVYRMTSHYPSHPAGSFYYPHLKRLPPIATFQFIKLLEYELTERFNHIEDENRYELLLMEHIDSNAISVMNNNNDDIAREIEEERQEEPLLMASVASSVSPVTPTAGDVVARGDKGAILNSIRESYSSPKKQSMEALQVAQGLKHRNTIQRKNRPPRNCRVSEWSSWSSCSKSCGIGEMQRHRQVKKHARRGGHPCPPLTETKWCGSARACKSAYFHW